MYEDRVEKGAALLDRVRPGWAGEIAMDRLAMETCDECILGQLYGNYFDGFRYLLKPLSSHKLFAASEFGFTLRGEVQEDYTPEAMSRFAALAEVWRAEIRRRLGKAEGGP